MPQYSREPHTFALNVCAAKIFASRGVSGESNKTLQVAHASFYHEEDMKLAGSWDATKGEIVFTECWKS